MEDNSTAVGMTGEFVLPVFRTLRTIGAKVDREVAELKIKLRGRKPGEDVEAYEWERERACVLALINTQKEASELQTKMEKAHDDLSTCVSRYETDTSEASAVLKTQMSKLSRIEDYLAQYGYQRYQPLSEGDNENSTEPGATLQSGYDNKENTTPRTACQRTSTLTQGASRCKTQEDVTVTPKLSDFVSQYTLERMAQEAEPWRSVVKSSMKKQMNKQLRTFDDGSKAKRSLALPPQPTQTHATGQQTYRSQDQSMVSSHPPRSILLTPAGVTPAQEETNPNVHHESFLDDTTMAADNTPHPRVSVKQEIGGSHAHAPPPLPTWNQSALDQSKHSVSHFDQSHLTVNESAVGDLSTISAYPALLHQGALDQSSALPCHSDLSQSLHGRDTHSLLSRSTAGLSSLAAPDTPETPVPSRVSWGRLRSITQEEYTRYKPAFRKKVSFTELQRIMDKLSDHMGQHQETTSYGFDDLCAGVLNDCEECVAKAVIVLLSHSSRLRFDGSKSVRPVFK